MILKILTSLILITMPMSIVTGLDITISHSPDVEMSLYLNGELINGSGLSEYHESKWMEFENETILTWSEHDETYNKTTTNTTHRFNGTNTKGT